ncbi:UPF0688 protein C1orf174 homolog isoform 1-T1 [Pholidichthys leucotaenia]
MPGQLDHLKSKKRKSSSEVKNSRKVAAKAKRGPKIQKCPSATESSSVVGHGKAAAAAPQERMSYISCECHQSAGRRRCSASPEHEGREGKENEQTAPWDSDTCGTGGMWCKQEAELMEYDDGDKSIYPDDDSNQILPVEQFFGNLDSVQDFPQRPYTTSTHPQRKERRRHYYAPEDSDEDVVDFSSVQSDDREDT